MTDFWFKLGSYCMYFAPATEPPKIGLLEDNLELTWEFDES